MLAVGTTAKWGMVDYIEPGLRIWLIIYCNVLVTMLPRSEHLEYYGAAVG